MITRHPCVHPDFFMTENDHDRNDYLVKQISMIDVVFIYFIKQPGQVQKTQQSNTMILKL